MKTTLPSARKLQTDLLFTFLVTLVSFSVLQAQHGPPLEAGATSRHTLIFNGNNQSATASLQDFDAASGTYEVWVRKANWKDFHDDVLFSNGIAHNEFNSFYVSFHPTVGLHMRYGGDNNQPGNNYSAAGLTATNDFTSNSWHHIAATWSHDANTEITTLKLFIDGVEVATSDAGLLITPGTSFTIGFNPASGYFGLGAMAEARLWNIVRTETEIADEMNSTLTGTETGLIAYWPFNTTTGAAAENLVAGGSAASLVNVSQDHSWQSSVSTTGLWGVTSEGGDEGYGNIFQLAPDGIGLENRVELTRSKGESPYADLTLASDGKFYGMTNLGGENNLGVLFEYNPVNDAYKIRFHFDGEDHGAKPRGNLTEGTDGKLYGMTEYGGADDFGVLFEFDPATGEMIKKIDFDDASNGKNPISRLTSDGNGMFYGTVGSGGTHNGGILFHWDPITNSFEKKFDFDVADGIAPTTSLTLAPSGKYYGMTVGGGANNVGAVFEYDPAGAGSYTKLADFEGPNGAFPVGYLTFANNGKLYGLSSQGGASGVGCVFEFDPDTNVITNKGSFTGEDGDNPNTSLALAANGKLYGMTYQGGVDNAGVLFEYDPETEILEKKIDFNGTNGSHPYFNSLTPGPNGNLYGMTYNGGSQTNTGILFEFDPNTGALKVNVTFNETNDGANLQAGLIRASNKKLYGVTWAGGPQGEGVLYEYDFVQQKYERKWSFREATGNVPVGKLTEGDDQKLFGMTREGGAHGFGTIYEFDLTTGVHTKRFDFDDTSTGRSPYGGLTFVNGKLYGMNGAGGANDGGVLFAFDLSTGDFTNIHNFGSDGASPHGSLTLVDGKLFGMARDAGAMDLGIIFQYDIATETYTKRFDFDTQSGSSPMGDLTYMDGYLYGMTSYDEIDGRGTIFRFDPVSGDVEVLHYFDDTDGANPEGSLTVGGNGTLYGMTREGGMGQGVIFEYGQNGFVKKHDFGGADGAYPGYTSLLSIRAEQTIAFNALPSKVYGDADFNLTATSDSGLPLEYTSSNEEVAIVSGNTVTIVGVGDVTITALQAGDQYFESVSDERSFTVSKATLTATAVDKSKVYGTQDPEFTIEYTGFVNGDDEDDITKPTLSASGTNAGTYPITLSGGSSANYDFTLEEGDFTITKASLTATADNKSRVYRENNPSFTITYTGFVTGDDVNSITQPTASSTATAASNAGPYAITLTGGAATNYTIALIEGTLTVNKATLTVTADNKSRAYNSANPALTFTYSGFVNGENTNAVTAPTVSVTATTISDAGTYPITLTGGSAANYSFAFVNGELTVTKINQTITFAALADKTLGDANFALPATASSGLAISYAAANAHVTITGSSVSLTSAGSETITATQSGNVNYNAAVAVTQTFCIRPAKPAITASFANPLAPVLTSSAATGNQWYKNNVLISGATNATLTANEAGAYTVMVRAGNCASTMSDAETIIITGIEETTVSFTVFPNPATHSIEINFTEAGDKQIEIISTDGKTMHRGVVSGFSTVLDVSDYTSGVFVVKALSAKGSEWVRFVKK